MIAFSYRIDQGVPMPRPQTGRPKYPFRKMEVGDSFLVECEDGDSGSVMNGLTSCIRWATYKTGFKFAQRMVRGGVRVWRTR